MHSQIYEGLTRAALEERLEEIYCDLDDMEQTHHHCTGPPDSDRCYCSHLQQECDDLRAHLQTIDEMNMHDGYDLD